MVIELRLTVWPPVAVTVNDCAVLVVPVFCVAKVSDVGLKPSVGGPVVTVKPPRIVATSPPVTSVTS